MSISKFGEYLDTLLILKKLNNKQFATKIGINRSQLYRFLRNEQVPDFELLGVIATKLNLRTSEYNKLVESYECSLYGSHIIESRRTVFDIVSSYLSQEDTAAYEITVKSNKNFSLPISDNLCTVPIHTKNNNVAWIYKLLEKAKQKQTKTTLRIILQPNISEVMDFLPDLLEDILNSNADILIEHVIYFKNTILDDYKLYNLKKLQTLLPLAKYESFYKIYYSSGNLNSDIYENIFPNLICLNKENAISISSDFQRGIYYTDTAKDVIALLNEEFDKIKKDCLPLFTNLHNLIEMSYYMKEFEENIQANTFSLLPQNTFITFPPDIIRKKLKDINEPDELSSVLIERIKLFRKRLQFNTSTQVMPLSGLDSFVTTGVLLFQNNIVFDIYERMEILKNHLDFVENEKNYNLYLMKEDNYFYSLPAQFYILGEELLYIVPSYIDYDATDNTILRETGIIQSFKDFFNHYFNKGNTIVDQIEVAKIIKEKITYLKDLL